MSNKLVSVVVRQFKPINDHEIVEKRWNLIPLKAFEDENEVVYHVYLDEKDPETLPMPTTSVAPRTPEPERRIVEDTQPQPYLASDSDENEDVFGHNVASVVAPAPPAPVKRGRGRPRASEPRPESKPKKAKKEKLECSCCAMNKQLLVRCSSGTCNIHLCIKCIKRVDERFEGKCPYCTLDF